MSDEEVYALIKLSRSVENPVRHKIHSILKSAVKFRGTMRWPLTAKPLGALPLAQRSFTHEWELWLKSLIRDFKYLFPFASQKVISGRCHIRASKVPPQLSKLGRTETQSLKSKVLHVTAPNSSTGCLTIGLFKAM